MVKRIQPTKSSKKKKQSLPPIHCKGCPIDFVPKDRRQHFHSPSCREAHYERTYFSRASVRKVCANPRCGQEFVTTKPGRQDYCKPECRIERQKDVRDGLAASVSAERATYLGDRYAALERDGFKCVLCGKNTHDGVKLNAEADGKGGFRTVCNLCVEGRKFNSQTAGGGS